MSDRLDGKWFQVSGNTNYRDWDKYRMPRTVRHGCMLPISQGEYDALIAKFEPDEDEEQTGSDQ